jgi:hypothetical protein
MKALYTLRTGAGVRTAENDGRRWAPAEPLPQGLQANAALALCRNAEARARVVEAPRTAWRDRRAA